MNNNDWNNQNDFNNQHNVNSMNQGNGPKKSLDVKTIAIIIGVVIVGLFFGSKLLGNKNLDNADSNNNNNNINIDNNNNFDSNNNTENNTNNFDSNNNAENNTNNNVDSNDTGEGTPSASTIQLGETIKIREQKTNYDLKIDSFEPEVKITSESGTTRTYAYLIGRVTNNYSEVVGGVSIYNVELFDKNDNLLSTCTARDSKGLNSKILGSIKANETKDVYFECYITKTAEAVKAVYTHPLIWFDDDFKAHEKKLEYYINLR